MGVVGRRLERDREVARNNIEEVLVKCKGAHRIGLRDARQGRKTRIDEGMKQGHALVLH